MMDLTPREWVVLVPIVAATVLMGVLPNLFLRPIEPSAARMVSQVQAQAPTRIQAGIGNRGSGFGRQRAVETRIPIESRIPNPESPVMSLNAIVPMLCVTAAAIAAMVAEAFRAPGERMPIGPLGAIGLVGRGDRVVPLVEPQCLELRRRAGRQLRPVRHRRADRRRAPVARVLRADDRARASAAGRVLRADAVCDRRHDADGDRVGPAGHLSRARSAVARRLCADGHPPRLARSAPRPRSSISCSARFRARSFSTASPSRTA